MTNGAATKETHLAGDRFAHQLKGIATQIVQSADTMVDLRGDGYSVIDLISCYTPMLKTWSTLVCSVLGIHIYFMAVIGGYELLGIILNIRLLIFPSRKSRYGPTLLNCCVDYPGNVWGCLHEYLQDIRMPSLFPTTYTVVGPFCRLNVQVIHTFT